MGDVVNVKWNSLIFTSIKLYETENPNEVIFKETDRGETGDEDAYFLKDIVQIAGDTFGNCEFKATKVSLEDAVKEIKDSGKKPMFMIHGFATEPGSFLQQALELENDNGIPLYGSSYFIPVFWPAGAPGFFGGVSYSKDKKDAKGAAKAFLKTFQDVHEMIPHKNLIAFSMGNFVLRNLSETNVKFDNIFHLGADVRYDLYHDEYINSGKEGCKDGLNVFNMLKRDSEGPIGKIYVVYNPHDIALWGSALPVMNNIRRLGRVGPHMFIHWEGKYEERKELTHPDIRNYLVGRPKTDDEKASDSHNYYFDSWAMESVEGFVADTKKK